jgi:multiple sugar transport system substrate-binding protein
MSGHREQQLNAYLMRRRQVLQGGAAAAAALALPGTAGRALAAPADPMHFVGWQYNPQIVAENVETFKTLYDETSTMSWCRASTTPWSRPS